MQANVTDFRPRAEQISIREASSDDRSALRRLAALDSQPALRGRVLVAEIGGELEAAMSVESGRSVADPFRPTSEAVALLAARAAQLRSAGHSVAHRRRFALAGPTYRAA